MKITTEINYCHNCKKLLPDICDSYEDDFCCEDCYEEWYFEKEKHNEIY